MLSLTHANVDNLIAAKKVISKMQIPFFCLLQKTGLLLLRYDEIKHYTASFLDNSISRFAHFFLTNLGL